MARLKQWQLTGALPGDPEPVIGGEANPIHKATYYRGVRAGRYPAPVRVSPGVSRVVKPQLVEAIQRMIAGKRALGGAQ